MLGSFIARRRGWVPSGSFTLGKWGTPVTVTGLAYLGLMLINICWPSSIYSARGALFNYGWVTVLVIAVIVIVGALYEVIARPDLRIAQHRIETK